MKHYLCMAAMLVLAFCGSSTSWAEDWPCWRGPRGDGTSIEQNVPLKWNGETGENIVWKVPVPGVGHASPIVYGDRIFTVTCLEEVQERLLLCWERQSGKLLWRQTVLKTDVLESKHQLNSFASSTPATDGELVYVAFLETEGKLVPGLNLSKPRDVTAGRMVVAAYDFAGNRRWIVRPGEFVSVHGFCSSPVIFGKLLIVNGDHDGESYIVALDKQTGKTVWKEPRRFKTRSYVTPLIRKVDGREQMVLSGSHCVTGFDPQTGKLIWSVDGPTEQFVATLVYDGEKFYAVGGFPTFHVVAIDPRGQGDITKTHVAWHVTNVRCYVPSPVLVDKYLLVADDRGTANCFDTATGERYWQGRLGNHFSASLTTVNGLVLFLPTDGVMKIVEPGPELKVVRENPLGEFIYASPAISDSQIFLRGEKHLYCIAQQQK